MRAVPLLLLALVLAACGDDGGSGGGTTTPVAGDVPAVDYTRMGGVGGSTTHLVVDAGGNARLDDYAFALSADERAELAAAAKDVDFAGNAGHDRGDAHPDAFVYGLRVDDTQVLKDDYVIPSPVYPLANVIERIATNHSPERRKLEDEARDLLVLATRDGGVAAEHIELRITPDGKATVSFGGPPGTAQSQSYTLTPDELMTLESALAPGPDALRSPRDPNIVVADGREWLIITDGQTINAADPIDNPQLGNLLESLEQVLEHAR